VRPDLDLSAYDLGAIARICQLVQGMPLAIVLATAWLEVLSFDEIAQEIAQSLDFLESQLRDMPARQRSVRATFDYSWLRLPPEAQQAFMRVAVFRGGFTREAAQAVAEADRRTLLTLVNKSFLSVGARHRYEVHELLRQYGEQHLKRSGQAAARRDRHLAYCVGLAETAEPFMRGPQQSEWLDRLEAEHDNLRAALQWALDTRQTELGLRLVGVLWWLWDNRGYFSEGRAWAEAMLKLPPPSTVPAPTTEAPSTGAARWHPRARALLCAGILSWLQSDYLEAHGRLEESLALATEAGDTWCQAYALCRLGRVIFRLGDGPRARTMAEQSLALFNGLGEPWGQSRPLRDLGYIALAEGDLATARQCLEQAMAQRRDQRDWDGLGDALTMLGEVEWAGGNLARAEALHLESLAICRDLPYKLGMAGALVRLGFAVSAQGRLDQATAYISEGLAVCRELGNRDTLAQGFLAAALVAAAAGDAEQAARLVGAMEVAMFPAQPYVLPHQRPSHARLVAELEAKLGPARLADLQAAGRALRLDEALNLVAAGEPVRG
jgi:tetratricopeptide (TPR) repeat protein